VLKLMNVRYLISARALENPGGLIAVAELPGTRIYENPGALPRFFLVKRIRRAGDMDAALAILRSRDFDARSEAVVEGTVQLEKTATAEGAVRVLEYGARQFVLEVDTPAPAFLVTSETAYPGWHAWVDGQPRTPVTTDVAFRGLAVPGGKHLVKMRFDPEILWRAAWLTLAAAFGLAMLWFGAWFGDN
jgi:hypothetical protein